MTPDIVIVCGARSYANTEYVDGALSAWHKELRFRLLVNGFAEGADKLAYEWSKKNGVQPAAFPALWTWHRKKGYLSEAGPIRNGNMLNFFAKERIAGLIAFKGGNGTADMVDQSRRAGVRLIDLRHEPADYNIVNGGLTTLG